MESAAAAQPMESAPAPASSSEGSSEPNIDDIVAQINQERNASQPSTLPHEETQEEYGQEQPNKLEEFERLADLERNHYRQMKLQREQNDEFQRERESWEQERDNLTGQFKKENPSKWLESQGMSIKELADSIMNEQDKDGTLDQNKVSYEEALEQAMDQMEGRFEEMYERKRGAEHEEMEEQEAYSEFSNSINTFISDNVDHFPGLAAFGGTNEIMASIEQEYEDVEDQYGEEYAEKWLDRIDVGDYAEHFEKKIADGLANALQLPQMRELVEKILSSSSGQEFNRESVPSENAPRTLTRNQFSGGSAPTGVENMTEQERINAAIRAAEGRLG